jgi:glycerol-3-phosphate dehydrogenase (NAD(P)+)
VTLACPDEALGRRLAEAIATPAFRPYLAADMVGAEAGGAGTNVLAGAARTVALTADPECPVCSK